MPKLVVLRFAECGGLWDWVSGLALRTRGPPHHALAGHVPASGRMRGTNPLRQAPGRPWHRESPGYAQVRLNIDGISDLGQL